MEKELLHHLAHLPNVYSFISADTNVLDFMLKNLLALTKSFIEHNLFLISDIFCQIKTKPNLLCMSNMFFDRCSEAPHFGNGPG